MGRLTSAQKGDLQARLLSFDFSGLESQLSYSLIHHYRSYVGRDFKTLAQVALFLLGPYMTREEKNVWFCLSKVSQSEIMVLQHCVHIHNIIFCCCTIPPLFTLVQVFRIAYCQKLMLSTLSERQRTCENFVKTALETFPELKQKVKIHLFLHLTQSMADFGPTSSFNTERYIHFSLCMK